MGRTDGGAGTWSGCASCSGAGPIFAWALYDRANSVFAATVIAGFFPVFFKQYRSAGAVVYVLATIGFSGAIVFYDALIVAVSPAVRNRQATAPAVAACTPP